MAAYLLFACGLYFHKYSGVGHIQLHLLLFNFSFHTISTTNQRNYVYVKNIRLIARFVAPFMVMSIIDIFVKMSTKHNAIKYSSSINLLDYCHE